MDNQPDNPYAAPTIPGPKPVAPERSADGLRPVVPWGGQDVLVVFALVLGLRLVVTGLVAGLSPESQRVLNALIADAVTSVVGFALAVLWLVYHCGASSSDLGYDWRRLPRDVILGVVAFAVLALPIYGLMALLTLLFPNQPRHPIIDMLTERPQTATLAVCAVSIVVLAPLVEEFVCRGVLQGWLQRLALEQQELSQRVGLPIPAWVLALPSPGRPRVILGPILISSLFFAGLHYSHGVAPIPLFFLAIALGYLYQRTRRLWASMVVHASLNTCSLALLWINIING